MVPEPWSLLLLECSALLSNVMKRSKMPLITFINEGLGVFFSAGNCSGFGRITFSLVCRPPVTANLTSRFQILAGRTYREMVECFS